MSKAEIDYSNTIIYKITCKDISVTDVYVGHTTNFVQRKHAHKQSCNNNKSVNHTCKIYEVIRSNGGWNNWKMEIINFFNCKDHYEARKKEQEYFITLNATLNSIEPMPTPKNIVEKKEKKDKEIFFCTTCNIKCNNIKLFEEHNNTKKHLNKLSIIGENTNTHNLFSCEKCKFNCSKKSDWDRHITRVKHIKIQKNTENISTYKCRDCDNIYKYHSGLWKHSKTCNIKLTQVDDNSKNPTNLIIELIKSNKELQQKLIDVLKYNQDK